jgi:hypothetical protein
MALRNATSHFTSSCGSIGFAFVIAHSLVCWLAVSLATRCLSLKCSTDKKTLPTSPETVAVIRRYRESAGYLFG